MDPDKGFETFKAPKPGTSKGTASFQNLPRAYTSNPKPETFNTKQSAIESLRLRF